MTALSRRAAALLVEIREALESRGVDEAELFLKLGRSRRFEIGPQGRIAASNRERGWAVRAGGPRSSLLACGSGELLPGRDWPAPDGRALLLPPAPSAPRDWREPPGLDAPLMVEAEAMALLDGLERGLAAELPGSRVLRAVLEDGSSEAAIVSSRGADAGFRGRAAALYVEVQGPGAELDRFDTLLAGRYAASFEPLSLARRLTDRLLVTSQGGEVERDRGEMLLAPPIGIALLQGLLPLLVGPGGEALVRRLRDRQGRIGSPELFVTDDGRLPDGVLTAPVDGEGVPTRRVPLIEAGVYRQPLVAWWQAGPGNRPSGCTRRASWRDVPRPGATHLYVEPDAAVKVASLVSSVSRGYYLLDALGPGAIDLEADRLHLPVCGFVLRQGRATSPIARATLQGTVSGFLGGVQGRARDLSFRSRDGLLGAPTLMVTGLELVP